MKNIVSIILSAVGLIIRVALLAAAIYFIYLGSAYCYNYAYRIYTEPPVAAQGEGVPVVVGITPDMSAMDIGNLFEEKGLIKDAKLFFFQYYLSEYREDVKPGVFELNTSMTAEEMMEAMTVKE